MSESPLDFSAGSACLVGGRCAACSAVVFPLRKRCVVCASTEVSRALLPDRGTLWTYTVQRFMPPSPPYAACTPEKFTQFGVGYVELDGVVRVESRLFGDPETFYIGMELKLVTLDLGGQAQYAFAPVDAAGLS